MQEEKKEKSQYTDGYVVGIGASAGGLEALQTLLSSMPTQLGFPYIVIQHLSPDYKSLLSEILSKSTEMPVIQVTDGMDIEPDHIYIIPPGKSMHIAKGVLFLSDQKTGELHLPIDTFFRSLAEESGAKAIAVILSGTGSDGTNGIKNIKENDGLILVQSPESCKFDGMSKSAIRTGLVDALLSPEQIAMELEHISMASKKGFLPQKTEQEINDDLMKRIYYILKKVSTVNFTHYKQATILRRIERRMMLVHKDSLADYVDYLYDVPEEARTLSKEVLIGVTNFFREPEFFECLKERAIYNIVKNCAEGDSIRAWIAGCSTGEEAYSIAILFSEVMEELKIKREIKIFATDLDNEAVTTAGKGVYGTNITSTVSAARISKFFTRKDTSYIVNREVRKMLVFAPHNVIQDPPFGKLDLISCRNLLIYFQPVLQTDLFSIFHAALKDGGYLFLGKSEAVGAYTEVFPVVDAAAKIFCHRSDVKIKGAKPIPFLQTSISDDGYGEIDSEVGNRNKAQEDDVPPEKLAINTALLEKFMPACLIINEENSLVYVYGDAKKYIAFPVGRMTSVLFDIIEESLRIPVSTVLQEAREKQRMVQYKDVYFTSGDQTEKICITAMPIGKIAAGTEGLCALVFAQTQGNVQLPDAVSYDIDHMAAQRITSLEQQLSKVQNQLNKSISEQETYNEELQATNEELLTANEELQSSNEELQSVNEELYTVNSEYQVKLTELAEVNDDITNFLATTLIGIIFVDSKLAVRRFTNYVMSEFSVMEQDIGRSIDFISYHFPKYDIVEACVNVLNTLVPDEREIVTSRGKTFFMRIVPFRTTENKILGCVITFVDQTAQKQEQAKLQSAEEQLSLAQQASAAKSDFLSRMSHEIRTPMNALQGLSELLLQRLDDKEAVAESARQISGTVKYMTSIVSDILEMSKIEHSQVELINEPFVMRDMLNRLISMLSARAADKKLIFDVDISDELDPVYIGDDTRLQQILSNFLTNAVKYTPAGGMIGLKAFPVEDCDDGRTVIGFIVSDTGVGISKEFLPDLFEPFAREAKNDQNAESSMGLGLTIAHNLIDLMDGSVSVESAEGVGSTFTIHIKLTPATKIKIAPEVQEELGGSVKYDLTGLNVLVAEDNDINRTILESLLSRSGITFVPACDGAEAVQVFTSAPAHSFDCILMDMRMPRMDGMEAATKIRASDKEDATSVPIIAVSANAFSDDIEGANTAGINYYITKPIDTKKLFALLNKLQKGQKKK